MSRTFLINDNTAIHSTTAHEIGTAVERAMREGKVVDANGELVSRFHFDLIEFVRNIKTPRLKDDVLNRLAFSIDAYISGALSRMLNELYQHSKIDSTYATYHDFLRAVEGLEASEESLYETGCDVTPSVERIRNLIAFRDEIHATIAGRLLDPSKYIVPDLAEFLAKPQMRNLSVAAEMGLQDIVNDDAGDDEDLKAELLAQYKLDAQLERMQQHRMDLAKAKSLVLLLSCLKADAGGPVADDDDAFFDMDARTQFGLMNSAMRSIVDTRRKAVTDTRVPVMEKATLRVEAKALIAELTTALAHGRFAELG